jgi:hypothetical protein
VGAFRFICNAAQLSYDDPIVYPGQPGAAHLHQFFGNTQANAHSTYQTLRTSGDSTCNNPLNRSAYWIPAMMDGRGQVVRPDYVSIYYKRRPETDPECRRMGTACVGLPRGLKYVFGYNAATSSADTNGGFHWNCDGQGATSGHFRNIPEAARGCPTGARLGAVIASPECWDGVNIDSPNHRSHVAYAGYGNEGQLRCPSTHPYVIPQFTLGAWYTTDNNLDRTGNTDPRTVTWHLSSDRTHAGDPMMTPGSSLHADWFGAWDDTIMEKWTAHCVNRLLNCSGGDLGNGWQLKNFAGFSYTANPRLVSPPTRVH